MQSSSLSLSEVQQQFEAWRGQKTHARERIPDELWQVAVQLGVSHPITKVAKTLGLDSKH